MKRLFVAAGLILLLILFATWHVLHLTQFTNGMVDQLEQSQLYLRQDNWTEAEAVVLEAYQYWEAHGFYLHAMLRHTDIDSIRSSFRELLAYLAAEEQQPAECAAASARLINQLELLIESELPTLKNIL